MYLLLIKMISALLLLRYMVLTRRLSSSACVWKTSYLRVVASGFSSTRFAKVAKRDFSPCVILTVRKFCGSCNQGKDYSQVCLFSAPRHGRRLCCVLLRVEIKAFACANAVLKTVGQIAVLKDKVRGKKDGKVVFA